MKIFDKGRPILSEYCEVCKKKIEPGEKMIITVICPTKGRAFFYRSYDWSFYGYIDDAPKYHENCYMKKMKEKIPTH